MVIREFFEKIRGGTLFYPGCHTKLKLKYEYQNYKEIFKRLKINYIETKKTICCGLPAYEAGYSKVAKEFAEKNFKRLNQMKIKKIITNCPECHYMFSEVYPKLISAWNIKVEHVSETIFKALLKIKIGRKDSEKVSYNDTPYLDNDKSREIIELFGGEIIEPFRIKEESFCCGGHGGVNRNYPEISSRINKERISQFPQNTKKIITSSGVCFLELKDYDTRVTEISTYILGKLRGQKI